MCNVCNVCNVLTNMPTWNNCKYATPLYFYRVNRIFFGFRAFYLFFIQILAVILHRNSKSSHAHRTFIALPSHTRTRVTAMRRSSSAKARSKYKQDFSKLTRFFTTMRNNFGNFAKFCSFKYKSKQVYLVLLILLFTPARFIPNPLVPAPRSYLSGGHGGN